MRPRLTTSRRQNRRTRKAPLRIRQRDKERRQLRRLLDAAPDTIRRKVVYKLRRIAAAGQGWGIGNARRDAVDPYAAGRELVRESPDHVADGGLAGAVVDGGGGRVVDDVGGGEEDGAAAGQDWGERADEEEVGEDVGPEDALEVRGFLVLDRGGEVTRMAGDG